MPPVAPRPAFRVLAAPQASLGQCVGPYEGPGLGEGPGAGPGRQAGTRPGVAVTLGRAGLIAAADKREGDGATPIGGWRLDQVFYRPDREAPPRSALPVTALSPRLGWCDAPTHPAYNRLVTLPFSASCEGMWREDNRYDLLVVLDYNRNPTVAGRGSAIFLHLMAADGSPTAGCVGFKRADLLALLAHSDRQTRLWIENC